MTRVAIKL